jgi:N-acetylmuramate 1-kinase
MPGVAVLRDYHAENIMLLGGKADAPQGLIDFQDALVGHPAYDLVSLLAGRAARCAEALEAAMLLHYCAAAGVRAMISAPTTPVSARSGMPRSSASSPG